MALLELKGITREFGMLTALDGIDLTVEAGEVLGIVGPNGSGKSTLVNVVSGYHRPFDGKRISGMRPDRIAAAGIARTFQANVLYEEATVVESMIISAWRRYKTNSWQALFETLAYREEPEAIVGRVLEILRLPGIAIALAADPRLLLDEPTTGMNHEEAMRVVENIRKIREQGVTVVLIEHNMRVLADLATKVAVLNFGTKIAEGAPREVMHSRTIYCHPKCSV